MAKEILAIPEQRLGEVIRVIRAGLATKNLKKVSQDTRKGLKGWCDDHAKYLKRLFLKEFWA